MNYRKGVRVCEMRKCKSLDTHNVWACQHMQCIKEAELTLSGHFGTSVPCRPLQKLCCEFYFADHRER